MTDFNNLAEVFDLYGQFSLAGNLFPMLRLNTPNAAVIEAVGEALGFSIKPEQRKGLSTYRFSFSVVYIRYIFQHVVPLMTSSKQARWLALWEKSPYKEKGYKKYKHIVFYEGTNPLLQSLKMAKLDVKVEEGTFQNLV